MFRLEVEKNDVLRVSRFMRAMAKESAVWGEKLPRLVVEKYRQNILKLFDEQKFSPPLSQKYLDFKEKAGAPADFWHYTGRFLRAVINAPVKRIRAGSFGISILDADPDIIKYVGPNEAKRPILRPAAELTINESSKFADEAAKAIGIKGGMR